ncbi:MAG TPA: hypothetical protein VF456_15260 [Vicinamibacterales bacterium]
MTTMKAILGSVFFISLLISAVGRPAVGAGAQGNRPPVPARASTTQQPADGGWPRAYVTPSGARLVIDEPQIDRWLDQKRTAMYGAAPCTDLGAQHAGTAAAAPTVLVSQNPAALMLLNGAAAYTPVMGTRFERVSNTESNVFPGIAGTVYFRVPGRWWRAQDPAHDYGVRYGPWNGAHRRGAAVYGPCDGVDYAAWYNPRTGNDARGAAAWGPGGAGGAAAVSRSAA